MSQYRKPKQSVSPIAGILTGLGTVAGFAVGTYAPFTLLIPGVAAGAMVLALMLFVKPPRSAFNFAVALPFGQGAWMLVGMFLLRVADPLLLAEALALVLVPLLFLFTPPLVPAIPLILFQLFGLVVNVMAFAEAKAGSEIHKALLVHIVFRVGSVGAIIFGIVSWYTQPPAPPPRRDRKIDEADRFFESGGEVPRRRRGAEDDGD